MVNADAIPFTLSVTQVNNILYKNKSAVRVKRYDGINECPYGPVGTLLWVREPFNELYIKGELKTVYKADGPTVIKAWRPSLEMKRIQSRILLRVTSIDTGLYKNEKTWGIGIEVVSLFGLRMNSNEE